MRPRKSLKARPELESLEARRPLSAGASTAPPAIAGAVTGPSGSPAGPVRPGQGLRFSVFRITNPTPFSAQIFPPLVHVRVQTNPPVPGQVYNILFLSMRNSTSLTFDAQSGLFARISDQSSAHAYPILTGTQQWKPGQVIAFYILTKQYYPLSPQKSAGFVFDLAGSRGIAIPGPSGIYLGIRYNPATFDNILDRLIVDGPNPYSGSRGRLQGGLADTAIWEFKRAEAIQRPQRMG